MLPRNDQIDDIEAIKATNKFVANRALEPIQIRSRQDLEVLIQVLINENVLTPVKDSKDIIKGYVEAPGTSLRNQFVVTVTGDTLLHSDITTRQDRGFSYSRFKFKNATTGEPIPFNNYGNKTDSYVYNEVLANMILSFKPQIKEYVHLTLPKIELNTWYDRMYDISHQGKNIIFITGHLLQEAYEKSLNPDVLANPAAQGLIFLNIASANAYLTHLKNHEVANRLTMSPQEYSDTLDTIEGLSEEHEKIIERLTQLQSLLADQKKEIDEKKEALANRERELFRNYIKPARKHRRADQASLAFVEAKLSKAACKKETANDAVEVAWGLSFFGFGLGLPLVPFVYLNKNAKRKTHTEYTAMRDYKQFMATKDEELNKLDKQIEVIEASMRELNTSIMFVDITEEEATVTNTVVVPRKM